MSLSFPMARAGMKTPIIFLDCILMVFMTEPIMQAVGLTEKRWLSDRNVYSTRQSS